MGGPTNAMETVKLESGGDEQALRRIASQTFDFPEEGWEKFVAIVGRENIRVARVGAQVLGGLASYPMGQYFGGKAIRTMGIALVCIAPEFRGNSYAFEMLSTVMRQGRDDGYPLACLFPTTSRFYRRLGFEQAGSSYTHVCSLKNVRGCKSRLPMRRIQSPIDSLPVLKQLAEQFAIVNDGNLDRDRGMWARLCRDQGNPIYCYLVGEPGSEQGYVIYDQVRKAGQATVVQQSDPLRILRILDMVAINSDAMETIWSFVAGHATVTDAVEWVGPPADERTLLLDEFAVNIRRARRWMLSLIDVRQALVDRGYPNVDMQLPLKVTDPLFAANSGQYTLRIQGGVAAIEEGVSAEPIEISAANLAPLFSGFTTAKRLQRYGKLKCSSDSVIEAADVLFAGGEPWMSDSF